MLVSNLTAFYKNKTFSFTNKMLTGNERLTKENGIEVSNANTNIWELASSPSGKVTSTNILGKLELQPEEIIAQFPDHEFVKKIYIGKSGALNGKMKMLISLVYGPYTFKRRKNCIGTGTVVFSCNGCTSQHKDTIATAFKIANKDGDEFQDEYKLVGIPKPEDHNCISSIDGLPQKESHELYKYKCDVCQSIFKKRQSLIRHLATEPCKSGRKDGVRVQLAQ